MIRCETSGVEGTRGIAAAVAALVQDGDLITLSGGLGAGKTTFAQGLAGALGVTDRVTSPTFTLANRYHGRLVVNHLDVYRVNGAAESRDLGIDELLDDGVTLIEWADVIMAALPPDRLDVRFGFGEGDDDRRLEFEFEFGGGQWSGRASALMATLEPWAATPRGSSC